MLTLCRFACWLNGTRSPHLSRPRTNPSPRWSQVSDTELRTFSACCCAMVILYLAITALNLLLAVILDSLSTGDVRTESLATPTLTPVYRFSNEFPESKQAWGDENETNDGNNSVVVNNPLFEAKTEPAGLQNDDSVAKVCTLQREFFVYMYHNNICLTAPIWVLSCDYRIVVAYIALTLKLQRSIFTYTHPGMVPRRCARLPRHRCPICAIYCSWMGCYYPKLCSYTLRKPSVWFPPFLGRSWSWDVSAGVDFMFQINGLALSYRAYACTVVHYNDIKPLMF